MELTYQELLSLGLVRKLLSRLGRVALGQDRENAQLNPNADTYGYSGLYYTVRIITA